MEKRSPVRIVLADHEQIFRDALRSLLDSEPEFSVVGEAGRAVQALQMVRDLHPDVLLLDLALPGGGLKFLKKLSDSPEPVRTIALTASADPDTIVAALNHGVRGVTSKESTTALLFKSIRTVLRDEYWICRQDVGHVIERMRSLAERSEAEEHAKKFRLTRREVDVVTAVAAGESNKAIAERLSVTEDTIKHHVSRVFDKLGVFSRLELAVFAINHKLVQETDLAG